MITGILVRGRRDRGGDVRKAAEGQSQRFEDVMLLALEMEESTTSGGL